MAAGQGSNELRGSLLTTQGVVAFYDGELDEARRLADAAIAVAPIGSSSRFRALANRAMLEWAEGDLEAQEPLQAAATEEAERAGDRPNLRWLEWTNVLNACLFGRWDESLRRAEEQIALGPHYTLDSLLSLKAYMLAARDARSRSSCRDEALALAERIADAQSAIPGLLDAAWASLVIGEEHLTRRLAERAYPLVLEIRHRAPGVDAKNTVLIIRTGGAEKWHRDPPTGCEDAPRPRRAPAARGPRRRGGRRLGAHVAPRRSPRPDRGGAAARGSGPQSARPMSSSNAGSRSFVPSERPRWCATRRACSPQRPRRSLRAPP